MPVRENKWGKRQLGINKHNARRRDTPPKKNLSLFSEIKDFLSMKQEHMLYKEHSDNNLKC